VALAADRGQIVPGPKEEVAAGRTSEGEPTPAQRRHRLAWAVLLARVFDVTVSLTPDCGGPMKIVAALTAPDTLSILTLYPAMVCHEVPNGWWLQVPLEKCRPGTFHTESWAHVGKRHGLSVDGKVAGRKPLA